VGRADHSTARESARPGKHLTTIDVSRRARGDDLDEKQMLFAFTRFQIAAVDNV
jgi:hypothetical protein